MSVDGPQRSLPPVAPLAGASLGVAVVDGIIMASAVPRAAALGLPIALLVLSAIFLVSSLVLLARQRGFAWPAFARRGVGAAGLRRLGGAY